MTKKEKEEIFLNYAAQIVGALSTLFDEQSDHGFFIDEEEFNDERNLTMFFHALANVAPSVFYENMTGENKNLLEFNQLANQLCFQYMKMEG